MARISMMAATLTASEFKTAVARFPRLSEKAKLVARAILVEGKTFEEVQQEFDASRQLAHGWASKVFEVFRPKGWITETITLPPSEMEKVRRLEADLRKQWVDQLPPARIARR